MLPGIVAVQSMKQAQVQLTQMDVVSVGLGSTARLQQGAHFLQVCFISIDTGKGIHGVAS
jgi:hypothetical protein